MVAYHIFPQYVVYKFSVKNFLIFFENFLKKLLTSGDGCGNIIERPKKEGGENGP